MASIMQHYGVPTRLLDFTEIHMFALYFALEAYDPQAQKDFAVFAVDHKAVMQTSIDYISQKDAGFRETRESVHTRQDKIFEDIVDRFAYDIAWLLSQSSSMRGWTVKQDLSWFLVIVVAELRKY